MKLSRAFAVCALLTICAALTTPDGYAAGKKIRPGKGPASQSSAAWHPLTKIDNNCTWRCSDGRTGGAEVNTFTQCLNACSGACGQPCIVN